MSLEPMRSCAVFCQPRAGKDEEMDQEDTNVKAPSQVMIQWIASLAISILCCAVLFIVFARYIVQIHEQGKLTEMRLELMQEQNNRILEELLSLKKTMVAPAVVAPVADEKPDMGQVDKGLELTGPAPVDPSKPPEAVSPDQAGNAPVPSSHAKP